MNMKKTSSISLIVFLIFGSVQLSTGQDLTNQQKSVVEKEVHAIFQTMVKAADSLNYDKISTGVDDRYHAGFIAGGSYYDKYDDLVNVLKSRQQDGSTQNISVKQEKISVLSDRFAILTASGDSKVNPGSGSSYTIKFLWTFVYEKIDGEWKVIQSHQSGAR
jgi:hypothetical protein